MPAPLLARLERLLPPRHRPLVASFLRFGVVGASAVPVDAAVVYACRGAIGLYAAGAVSYLVAATWTFVFNRLWSFKGHGSGPVWRQWLHYLGANLSGLVLNRGLYAVLVTVSPLCRDQPVFAVAAGALAGMVANFAASRRLVFRTPAPSSVTSPEAPPPPP